MKRNGEHRKTRNHIGRRIAFCFRRHRRQYKHPTRLNDTGAKLSIRIGLRGGVCGSLTRWGVFKVWAPLVLRRSTEASWGKIEARGALAERWSFSGPFVGDALIDAALIGCIIELFSDYIIRYMVISYIILYCIILYCIILYYIALYNIALYHILGLRIILLRYISLYYILRHPIV